MMFDHTHYVPVLKWKAAERGALNLLADDVKDGITPLLELVPPEFSYKKLKKSGDLVNRIHDCMNQIQDCLNSRAFFFDISHLNLRETNHHRIIRTFDAIATKSESNLIFVLDPSQSENEIESILNSKCKIANGVCIRVNLVENHVGDLRRYLSAFCNRYNITHSNSDLIVDLIFANRSNPSMASVIENIPFINSWRSFTLLSGAFPVNLTHLRANNEYFQPRLDWLNWRREVTANNNLVRIPTFSDYTIQYPEYQVLNSNRITVSASIRYTSNEHWVIMRGEGLRSSDDYQQYPALAELLMDRREYMGGEFSGGDAYIQLISDRNHSTGNPMTWLRAGFNHHITFVKHQLNSLFVLKDIV